MSIIVAFFDVDETIINIKSMLHFYEYWTDAQGEREHFIHFVSAMKKRLSYTSRAELNILFYKEFAGTHLENLESHAKKWFDLYLSSDKYFIRQTVERIHWHQNSDHQIVFVSGSMKPLLKGIGKKFNVNEMLCTQLLIDENGKITGEICLPPIIGQGKKLAIENYADQQHLNLNNCYAYGDDISDIPMLESVGFPICVGANTKLAAYAAKKTWNIITTY